MSVTFTWLGHSAFLFEVDGHRMLLDPFLTGNPLAARTPSEIACEIIFLTHAHGDHIGDAVPIAIRNDAKVVSNVEIAQWAAGQGVNRTHGQNTGGGFDHGFVHAKQTIAFHSSSFPDGSYGGSPNGFIFTTKSGQRIYFAGDTALFSDMQLIGDANIDIAFLPIGDNYTMGPDDALRAVKLLQPKHVIPVHYDTWGLIAQDAAAWAKRVAAETGAQVHLSKPGESFTL